MLKHTAPNSPVLSVVLTGAALLVGNVTLASTIVVGPGGQLTLGNSYTNANPNTTTAGAVIDNDVSGNAASSYTYGDGFATTQTAIAASGVPSGTYGFYDNFVFTVSTSVADAITSTISLSSGGSNTQIVNLDAQLFMLSGNPSLPSFVPSNMVNDNLSITNFTLNPEVSGSTIVLDPTQTLASGTYVLEIRGLADGSAGGSYSGVLDITPVPLPPGLPLLLSGLAGVGLVAGRRRSVRVTGPQVG